MPKTAIKLTYFLIFFNSLAWGSNLPKNTSVMVPLKLPTNAPINSKERWIEHMQKELPIVLCQENQFFVRCFQTDKKECINLTTLLVEACLNNVKIALPDNMAGQGEKWGQIVGRCSYDLYEKFMQPKKHDLPDCRQVNANDDSQNQNKKTAK